MSFELDLDTFVDGLIQESKTKQKEQKEQLASELGLRHSRGAGTWEITALTLVKQIATCLCCGHAYEYPGTITLQHDHPKLGTRYIRYDGYACPDIAFSALPKRILEVKENVPACHVCFDLTSIVKEALDNPASNQYSLPFTFYDGKVPIALGGKCKAGQHGIVFVNPEQVPQSVDFDLDEYV